MSHVLTLSTRYKQTVNTAKNLLNIVQTSRKGLKIGEIEFSTDLIKKLLSIYFSAAVVIIRTGDKSELWLGATGATNSTVP